MSETMSLVGGIDMYSCDFKRYKSDISPQGRRVVFLAEHGYDIEREIARKYLSKGQVLTVKEIYVGRSISDVELEEYPGKKFNTVMFADVDEVNELNHD